MKITIKEWKVFEKENAVYFTRDINIKNEFSVYAIEISKKTNNLLVYMDLINFKYLGFIKLTDNIEIIDGKVNDDWEFKPKFSFKMLLDSLYYQDFCFNNIFAPRWMFVGTFLADIYENPVKAKDEFSKNYEQLNL